jgi:hypothetical protein
MASTGGEKEKIQSPQNSTKLASSRRACHKISNDVNGSSNRVTDRKIFAVKVLVNLAQSAGMSQHRTADVNISTDDVSICTGMWHSQRSTCHDDVMMMWQHQKLPCVTHFWHFPSICGPMEKCHVVVVQPCGRPYRTW